jgi:mono/diheme cytochrome c family protein
MSSYHGGVCAGCHTEEQKMRSELPADSGAWALELELAWGLRH